MSTFPGPIKGVLRRTFHKLGLFKGHLGPSSLRMHLDQPGPGTVLKNSILEIRGWAFSTLDDVVRIEVWLEDSLLGTCKPSEIRLDVALVFPHPNALYSGFIGRFTLPQVIASSKPTVIIRAIDKLGNRLHVKQSVQTPSPENYISLDNPIPGSKISEGPIRIRGQVSSDLRVIRIDVFLNNVLLGMLPYDVETHMGEQTDTNFDGYINLFELEKGKCKLGIRVSYAGGDTRMQSYSMNC